MRRAEKGRGAAKAVLLKWLKEGEWRREEGIVEFIAILRWPHEACIFRQSESNWLHFGRTYQCRLGFTKCALPKREKMPYHFLSICWTASSNLILTPAANIDSVLIHSPLYCTEKDKDPSGAKKRDAPALFSVHAGCLPHPVKQRSMWRLLVPFLRWAQKKEKPSEGGAAASIL